MHPDANQPEMLTLSEAAALAGTGERTISRAIKAGRLPAVRLPAGWLRVKREDVERLMTPVPVQPTLRKPAAREPAAVAG